MAKVSTMKRTATPRTSDEVNGSGAVRRTTLRPGYPQGFNGSSIDIYLNQSCNLKCTTCFLGDDYFNAPLDMTPERVREILVWAAAEGVSDVAFLGGEPTMHNHLADVIQICHSLGMTARLVTNATAPFRKFLHNSSANSLPDSIYVSLDGATERTNDAIRGPGTFRQVLRALDELRRASIPHVLTCTLSSASIVDLDALIELAESTECIILNIHWLSPVGRASAHPELLVDIEQWDAAVQRVGNYVPRRAELTVRIQEAYASATSPEAQHCAVREFSNLEFFPNGSIYACGLLVAEPQMNGYLWHNGGIIESERQSELDFCSEVTVGCPVRLGHLDVSDMATLQEVGRTPICIYERVSSVGS